MDKRFDSQWWCVDNYSKDNYRVEFFPLQFSPVQQHGVDNVGSPGCLSVGGVDEHCILGKTDSKTFIQTQKDFNLHNK